MLDIFWRYRKLLLLVLLGALATYIVAIQDKDEEGYAAGFCFACSQPPIRKSTVTTASR